jgi:hypothetical protein
MSSLLRQFPSLPVQLKNSLRIPWGWKEAQQILSDYWPAVQALATKLLKHQTLDGRDVHLMIWQTIGYPDADWRFGALKLQ